MSETQKTHEEIAGEVAMKLGTTKKFTVPSGGEVEIREQNGADDDVISNPQAAKEGWNLNNFIMRIVVGTNMTKTGRFDKESILDLKLRDKYVILFMSRIFSLGSTVKFSFDWGNGEKYDYQENLERYVWDYSLPISEFPFDPTDEGYDSQKIMPYPEGEKDTMELTLKSGKTVRMKYLNGHSEHYLMNLTEDQKTRNAQFKARQLEQKVDEKWIKVDNFEFFSPRDMSELRFLIEKMDPEFASLSEIEHPKTGEIFNYPVVSAPDFFFPTEI